MCRDDSKLLGITRLAGITAIPGPDYEGFARDF